MSPTSTTVSAVIPAYNEEKMVAEVLTVVKNSPLVEEVVVVNDGSTDHTLTQIHKVSGIRVVNLEKNTGKANAVAEGILHAHGKIILLVDADLGGLTNNSIQVLLRPLLDRRTDVTIGYPVHYKFLDFIFRPLAGERAYFKKDLLPYLDAVRAKGYGLELFLNFTFREKRIQPIPLPEIYQPLKYEKQDWPTTIRQTIKQTYQIIREVVTQKNPFRFFHGAYLKHFFLR